MDLLHQLLHADANESAAGPLVEAHAWFSSVDWPALRAGTALPPAAVADAMAPELLEKMLLAVIYQVWRAVKAAGWVPPWARHDDRRYHLHFHR